MNPLIRTLSASFRMISILLFLQSSASLASPASIYSTLSKLKSLTGQLVKPPGGELWVLEGAALPPELDQLGDSALAPLVDCLSKTELTSTQSKGHPVSWGIMCFYALRTMTYFECTDSTGEVASCVGAPPEFDPNLNPAQLKAAQAQWKKELSRKHRRFHLS